MPDPVTCPTCGATDPDECSTSSGRDHPSRRRAIIEANRPDPAVTPQPNRPDTEL